MASANKSLAQKNKSVDGIRATQAVGLTVMWEKQRTNTLLRPPQSEQAEFDPLC